MNKSVAIATFTFIPDYNGVALATYNLFESLYEDHNDITIITSKRGRPEKTDKYKIVEFDIAGSGVAGNPFTGETANYVRYLEESAFDIIYFICWHSWPADLALPVLDKLKCCKVLVSHGVSNHSLNILNPRSLYNWLKWQPYFNRMDKAMQLFDHVVFLSDRIDNDRMYDRKLAYKTGLKCCSVIPNSTSFETLINRDVVATHFARLRKEIIENNSFIVLNVSNFEPIKNQQLTLACFMEAGIDNSVMIFIGSGFNRTSDNLMKNYEKMKGTNKYPGRVIFLEALSREEIFAWYLVSDLFLLTSRSEVQPLVLLDALYTNLSYIATDTGCIREMKGGVALSDKNAIVEQIKSAGKQKTVTGNHTSTAEKLQQLNPLAGKALFARRHVALLRELFHEN
jgi:glycosyltransferase involved in cell wall biosynthesis